TSNTISFLFERWSQLNDAILEVEEYQKFEQDMHPHGDLTADDVKKLYFYFNILNKARLSLFMVWNDDVDVKLGNTNLNLVANLLYKDRQFVRDHAFPRGYVHLPGEIELRWAKIEERDGVPLSMAEVLTLPKKIAMGTRLRRFFGTDPRAYD
ncbi:MAG: hypothetical protein AAGK57_13590, partial [Pseudomonadota bacterium]